MSWLLRSAAGVALLTAASGVGPAATAAVLHYQFTVTDAAGSLPDTLLGLTAYTYLGASTTLPTQATMVPGDVVEFDLFAPAGLQFVVMGQPITVSLSGGFSGGVSLVANLQSFSVAGQGGSGTINAGGNFLFDSANSIWLADVGFNVTGPVSFTELSAQFVVPGGFSGPTAAYLDDPTVYANTSGSDPGSIIALEPVPADAPEPATLAMLCAGVAGLTAVRRRRSAASK